MANNLNIYEGADKTWTLTIYESDGETPRDITGYTFLFTVKRNINDSDDEAIIKKIITSHSDPTHGVTNIVLEKSDTAGYNGTFMYDCQWLDDQGNKTPVLKKAEFLIEQRVGDDFD